MAKAITANAPLSIAMTKRIVREAPNWAEAEIWTLQRPLVDLVIGSEDALEGARAFSEKRAPQWKGR
jgi:enoyl-CoA hydratase